MIPNNFIPINVLISPNTSTYFDTGIVPSDDLEIDGIFHIGVPDTTAYIFGARNTNSNTSAGQTNMEVVKTSGSSFNGTVYCGYNSARTQSIDYYSEYSKIYFTKRINEITVYSGDKCKTISGNESAFTGTRNMYLLARNNGGTVQTGGGTRGVYAFRASKNGTLLKNYVPVYNETDQTYGFYDLVNDTYENLSGNSGQFYPYVYALEVGSNGNGSAYIDSETVGNVNKMLFSYRLRTLVSENNGYINIGAKADDGYIFKNWTDENGNVISTEQYLYYRPTPSQQMSDVKLYANFEKITNVVQNNDFRVVGLPYGIDGNYRTRGYARLVSADITEDMVQKATSTIIVDEVPSVYQPDVPIIIYDPKGLPVFIGNIENISGNVLTVREPLSIVDNDFIMKSTFNVKDISVKSFAVNILEKIFNGYVGIPQDEIFFNGMLYRKCHLNFSVNDDRQIYIDPNKNFLYTAQTITENETINAEEYILNMANNYALYFEPKVKIKTIQDGLKEYSIQLNAINTNASKKLTFGNNSEELLNINIETETQETTLLMIFNEALSTMRGVFGTKYDGSIGQMPQASPDQQGFIANDELKMKVLSSSEDFNTLINQYLSNGMFNHKITMTVDLTKTTFTFDDFKIGNLIDFYHNNKLYKSIITARRYSVDENNHHINSIDLTLGKVRNNLTSKLNLGKVKK